MKIISILFLLSLSGCAATGAFLQGMGEASRQNSPPAPISNSYHHETCLQERFGQYSCTQDY